MNEYQHEVIKKATEEIEILLTGSPELVEYQTRLSEMLIGLDDNGRRMLLLKAMQLNMVKLKEQLTILKERLT